MAVAASGSAHAAALLPVPSTPRSGSDPIQIELSDIEPDAALFVLLDGQDVTGFGAIDGVILTVALAVPLAGGDHEVSLLRQLPGGQLAVAGAWTVEVRQSERFETAGFGLDASHNLWVRADEGDTSGLPHRVTSDGAAELRGIAEGRDLRVSGTAPLLWDTLEESFGGDNATVGDWLLEASTAPVDARVGHQEAATSTLALDAFNRRGLSLALRSERLRSELTGFSVRGTPVVGYHDGFGVHEESNRVNGLQLYTRLAESESLELAVTGVWLTGESPDGGSVLSGTVGDDSGMDGTSWGMQGAGSLFGRRVQASGGYASTWADYGEGDREDDAGRANPPEGNGDDILGLSASINLPIWSQRIDAGIEEAVERRRAAEASRRGVVAEIERSLGELTERLELTWRQLRLLDDVLAIQAEESLSSAEAAYGAGNLNALDLLDAERVLLDVRTSTARTRADWAVALARLEGAVGRPVDLTPSEPAEMELPEVAPDTRMSPDEMDDGKKKDEMDGMEGVAQ